MTPTKGLIFFLLGILAISYTSFGYAQSNGIMERLIGLYRENLGHLDLSQCPSYPSCSHYAQMAFKKHGLIMGWIMTVDRLFHEGREEEEVSGSIFVEGHLKIFDPVENNDFWWHEQEN